MSDIEPGRSYSLRNIHVPGVTSDLVEIFAPGLPDDTNGITLAAEYLEILRADPTAIADLYEQIVDSRGEVPVEKAKPLAYAASTWFLDSARDIFSEHPRECGSLWGIAGKTAPHRLNGSLYQEGIKLVDTKRLGQVDADTAYSGLHAIVYGTLIGAISGATQVRQKTKEWRVFNLYASKLAERVTPGIGDQAPGTSPFIMFVLQGTGTGSTFITAAMRGIEDRTRTSGNIAAAIARSNLGWISPITAVKRASLMRIDAGAFEYRGDEKPGQAFQVEFELTGKDRMEFSDPLEEWCGSFERAHPAVVALGEALETLVGCPAAKHLPGSGSLVATTWHATIDTLIAGERWTPDREPVLALNR